MNKLYFVILILFSFISNSLSQNHFRIRVEDQETNNPIQGALVYIEEIPLGDKETDLNGFVVYQNIPLDRKVRFHVRKSGYDPFSDEFVANPKIKSDNNRTVKLKKVSETPQVIIYGEVSDSDGKELEGATVEVTVLGKPFIASTDKSGNYQIKIDGNTLKSIPTFQIEAKHKGCERYKASKPVPKLEIINEDIVLKCEIERSRISKEKSNQPIPITSVKKGSFGFELLRCEQIGQTIRMEFLIKNNGPDLDLTVWGNSYSRIIEGRLGKEFNPESITISDKINNAGYGGARKTILQGYPVKMMVEFGKVSTPISILAKCELLINYGQGDMPIEFRNIPVKTED